MGDKYGACTLGIFQHGTSIVAAAIFCLLFSIVTLLHIAQMITSRTWYLTALVVGAICESVGFGARIGNAIEERADPGCWSMGVYLVSTLGILVAPAFMAASIYMILARIILLVDGEVHAIIKRRWLTKIFVTGDALSLLLQASGGGMQVKWREAGNNVVIGGLFVQLFFFGFFVLISAIFHRRMISRPTMKSRDPVIRWQRYLLLLYVTSILILVRSIFRVVEYIQGFDGALLSNEVYMYIFDATLMLVVLLWMGWFHPSEIGLLLRGEPPISHGLELLKLGRTDGRQRHTPAESLSSYDETERMQQNHA